MNKCILQTSNAPAPVGHYSQAVSAGDFIFCSGQIPLTTQGELVEGDIKAQTRQVLKNLRNILEAAGSSLEKIVKITVFLSNIQNFAEFNQEYILFFQINPPARSAVESPHLPKGVDIEIEAIATL